MLSRLAGSLSSHKDLELSKSVPELPAMENRAQGRSGGLLEVKKTSNSQVIQLIHQTAKGFLFMTKNPAKFQVVLSGGRIHLATICVLYPRFSEFESFPFSTKIARSPIRQFRDKRMAIHRLCGGILDDTCTYCR